MTDSKNGGPYLILLVEDNPDHAELVRRALKDHHVANKIFHLSDGAAALDYLFRRGEYAEPEDSPRPHLILLDLRLPKVDGLEVLNQIKSSEETRRIPVVIISTSAAERDIMTAYDLHANSYLTKPTDFEKFQKLINDFGFFWLMWNKNLTEKTK